MALRGHYSQSPGQGTNPPFGNASTGVTYKIPVADNKIIWAMKLEEKRFAGLQRSKFPRAAGLPEVHFVGIQPTYKFKPVLIRDPHPDFDFVPPLSRLAEDNRSV